MQKSAEAVRSKPFAGGFLLAGALLAGAQAMAGDIWLGVGAGQVKAEGVNAAVALGGELRLELGKHFALQPDIGYWQRTETVSGVSVKASDFSFGVTALVLLPAGSVRFFVGAGPSVHSIGGDVDYYGFSVASDSLTRLGVGVLGGVDVGISRTAAFFMAARYDWISLETDDPDSIDERRIYGGFRLRL